MTDNEKQKTDGVLVRFAPSPTGYLHVGNVRTALANFLFAKSMGGRFMLRVDDTDRARSAPEFEAALKEDLQWLGLNWDVTEKQSDRFDRYELGKQKLIEAGRLYPCYETPEEIDVKRKMLISRGLPPIYDRSALNETDAKRKEYEAEGRCPHWRFKLDHAPIVWEDMIRGRVEFDGAKLSDPVLFREDGVVLFTFATSVDDGEHGITHIIRGEDHVSNTATQVQIMEALGHKVPVFGHMALLKMKEGKISKRVGGGDIRSLREGGVFPLVLASYLAKIGTSDAIELADSMDALVESFSTDKLGRAMANYDPLELERLNVKQWHRTSYDEAKLYILDSDKAKLTQQIWEKIRPNVKSREDISSMLTIFTKGEVISGGELDAEYLKIAADLLPTGTWDDNAWDAFVSNLKQKTGRKGKDLFMPIRRALTAGQEGPELKDLFVLLGRSEVDRLLRQQTI